MPTPESPHEHDRNAETTAVLADRDLMRQLVESEADVAAGRLESVEDLAAAMRR